MTQFTTRPPYRFITLICWTMPLHIDPGRAPQLPRLKLKELVRGKLGPVPKSSPRFLTHPGKAWFVLGLIHYQSLMLYRSRSTFKRV
jgi:hypothetical protein